MRNLGWAFVEFAALLLAYDEREAVLGDLSETGEKVWLGLFDVLGLVIRRQLLLWKSWRPWLAGFGLALPGSFLLMGASVSVSWKYTHLALVGVPERLLPLVCEAILLVAWAWTGGFVVGSLSRRTLWVSALLCFSPCLFCLSKFRVPTLSRFSLFLFLVPALVGVFNGVRKYRLRLQPALILAVTVTVVMALRWTSTGLFSQNWLLIWPAWYIVASTRRRVPDVQ